MIGYITKWALTQGIIETELIVCSDTSTDMVKAPKLGAHAYLHREGSEWHRTRESAVVRANEMRLKKVAALQKQIKKLSIPFK